MTSIYSKDQNSVSLYLGKIVNLGVNNASQTSNSNIGIFVTYKISPYAKVSDVGTITLTALVEGQTATFTYTVNVIASAAATIVT